MTTKTRFDYRAACAEVAAPAVSALPAEALAIYRTLRDDEALADLWQNASLEVPMPEALRARFEALDEDTLSRASWALFHFGQWGGNLDEGVRDTRGTTWKFSHLADQVLRARLKTRASLLSLPRRSIGYHFEVHNGALRLCASSPDMWCWLDVGPATESYLAIARAWRGTLPGCPATRYTRRSPQWQQFEAGAYEATRAVPEALLAQQSEDWRVFSSVTERYMREDGKGSNDCPECGTQQLFKSPACNHQLACSHYPLASRIDAVLRHAQAFGLSVAQIEAARAAIAATAPDLKAD